MAKKPSPSKRVAKHASPQKARRQASKAKTKTKTTKQGPKKGPRTARGGGRIPPFEQPKTSADDDGPLGPDHGGRPRANTATPGDLPTGTHLRDNSRDTHVGYKIFNHHYATKTGPNEYSTVDSYEVRSPLLSREEILEYRRISRPLQQVRELVKNLYAKQPELMTKSSDVTLLEVIYQYADDNLAAFIRDHRKIFIEVFSVVSAGMVQTAATQIRCHDGDIEVMHADYWWTWCLRTMPRRYILDCMGLPRNTPGRIVIDVTRLTQDQLSRFIRCRMVAAWLRSAKTASALTERCNVMRRTGTPAVQKNLPLLDVAEFDVHGVFQQPFTARRAATIERQTIL